MSVDYYLICEEAKECIDIARRNAGGEPEIHWQDEETMRKLNDFFLSHKGKTLRYVSEYAVDDLLDSDTGWVEVDD